MLLGCNIPGLKCAAARNSINLATGAAAPQAMANAMAADETAEALRAGAAAGGVPVPLQVKEQMDIMMGEGFKIHKADMIVVVGESIKVMGDSLAYATGKHLATMNNDIVQQVAQTQASFQIKINQTQASFQNQINQTTAAFKDDVHMAVDGKIVTAVNAGGDILTEKFNKILRERDVEFDQFKQNEVKKMHMQVDKMQKELNDMKKLFGDGTTSRPVAQATSASAAPGSNGAKASVSAAPGSNGAKASASAAPGSSGAKASVSAAPGSIVAKASVSAASGSNGKKVQQPLPFKKRPHGIAFVPPEQKHWGAMVKHAPMDTFVWTSDIVDLVEKEYGINLTKNSKKVATHYDTVNKLMWNHYNVRPAKIKVKDGTGKEHEKMGFRGFAVSVPDAE